MPTVLIVHGAGSTPESNWFPWLKQTLEADGFEVIVPQFPNTPSEQTLNNWLTEIDKYDIHEDTIAVGHSLGAPFLLNLLEKRKLKAVYLVAGFIGLLSNEFDEVIHTFSNKEFDWNTIKTNCKSFHIIYSNDDPHVSAEKSIQLGAKLGIEPRLIKAAGHFNFSTFEYLYSELISGQ
jgi:predicted alpha/beta hydrolase family esterase